MESSGVKTLFDANRQKHNLKNRTDEATKAPTPQSTLSSGELEYIIYWDEPSFFMASTASPTLSLDVALQQAVAHHQAGRLQEAEQLYRTILQAQPYQPDANHNLGVLAGQVGQHAAGLPYLKTALVINPSHRQYSLSYADALLATGRAKEALDILQTAMQRGLNTPAAHSLRQKAEAAVLNYPANGKTQTPAEIDQLVALFNAGRYGELESRACLMIEQYPDSGLAWKMLGISFQIQGKEALPALQKAVELLPYDAEAHYNLGNTLQILGQFDNSVTSYRRALEIAPDDAETHNNLGNALQALGQIGDAVASYRRALEINPSDAKTYNNLANAQLALRQFDGAVENYRRALGINPDLAMAHNNLGIALQDLGRLDGAVASYRRALEIQPDLAEAHSNLGAALQDLGQVGDAMASYRRALEIKPDLAEAYSNLLFICNHLPDQPAAMLLAEARNFGDLVARKARPHRDWRNIPESGGCLRVGLVSGDMREHPVGYFIEGVLAALTTTISDRLEFFAYSNHYCADRVTERIKAYCRGWHSAAGLSDESLAQRIRDDDIDILIDLSGHTAHNRLPMFAWKPAPVQASWLGYLGTTGVAAMDYLIADHWTLPKTEEAHFSEKIYRLPETYLCFTPPDEDIQVSALPANTNGYITFGSFNNLTKINDTVVALWARILASVPDSRLFLKAKQLKEASVRQSLAERFAAHGIDPRRLMLEGSVPHRAEHLATYHRVDIALDPFPYPGITTSVESLWMGVPVLTQEGDRFPSRQGVGLLINAGLPEWIAADADDYVARAMAHAGDLQRLAALRKGLRDQVLASPIFDASRFAYHFEVALRGMWQKWCGQQQGRSL